MGSLDVLDYQVGLDEALAKRGADGRPLLEGPYRKQAAKDVRRLVEAMAFRFAILDQRPLPEDLDYLRAIEALKRPEQAAPVLARRRPIYARVRRRRLVTTFASLAIIAALVGVIAYFGVSEKADTILDVRTNTAQTYNFSVPANVTRLYIAGNVLPAKGQEGTIEIFLYGPDGRTTTLWPDGDVRDTYLRHNVEAPPAGDWRVLIDLNGGTGAVSLMINAVTPR